MSQRGPRPHLTSVMARRIQRTMQDYDPNLADLGLSKSMDYVLRRGLAVLEEEVRLRKRPASPPASAAK